MNPNLKKQMITLLTNSVRALAEEEPDAIVIETGGRFYTAKQLVELSESAEDITSALAAGDAVSAITVLETKGVINKVMAAMIKSYLVSNGVGNG